MNLMQVEHAVDMIRAHLMASAQERRRLHFAPMPHALRHRGPVDCTCPLASGLSCDPRTRTSS